MAQGQSFFVLHDPITAAEADTFLGRLVVSKTSPLDNFSPISLRNKAYRRTDELIPGILLQPETLVSIDWTATAVRKRSITWQLSALLNLNLPSIVDDRLRLESELVKRYILPDPEATFRKLMKNDFYNQEAWKLLRKTKSKSNRLYLVTGFITASESTWAKRFESTRNKTHTYKHVPDEQIIATDNSDTGRRWSRET
ncbi:hypothetical protein FOFC_21468 [Fusarium oxysporum]|nr:hypothetical protein FOFC_21468 [Fusarium oxysporum]